MVISTIACNCIIGILYPRDPLSIFVIFRFIMKLNY